MIKIVVPETEYFDEKKCEFVSAPGGILQLEHSLLSVSKWEAKWGIPFLDKKNEKTYEQSIDYIRFMTINKNVDPNVYNRLSHDLIAQIDEYINSKQTATWFSEQEKSHGRKSNRKITSELIYYWMIVNQIPFECEKWHLNRLLTLIQVCNIENAPKKKMSKRDVMAQNRALNAKRRSAHRTRG